jgi:hypothetical protein
VEMMISTSCINVCNKCVPIFKLTCRNRPEFRFDSIGPELRRLKGSVAKKEKASALFKSIFCAFWPIKMVRQKHIFITMMLAFAISLIISNPVCNASVQFTCTKNGYHVQCCRTGEFDQAIDGQSQDGCSTARDNIILATRQERETGENLVGCGFKQLDASSMQMVSPFSFGPNCDLWPPSCWTPDYSRTDPPLFGMYIDDIPTILRPYLACVHAFSCA